MILDFNIDKAIAAAGYIIDRDGGKTNMLPLIKKLYYSDRTALIEWGNSITGDALVSMEKGPIVSTIYDLIKGRGVYGLQARWNEFIRKNPPYDMVLTKSPNRGVLSDREIEVLEKSRLRINSIRGSIPNWLHENCPEWENPGTSSSPIDPSTILRIAKRSEDEIRQLEASNQEISFLKTLLRAG